VFDNGGAAGYGSTNPASPDGVGSAASASRRSRLEKKGEQRISEYRNG
jgi:hypothetical protein